jgi:phospholipid N-methyltransferase
VLAAIEHRWRFLNGFVRHPNAVGAVAPSSRALAAAVCEPLVRSNRPASVLEVGAGTGAVTRYLGTVLTADDELDVCEINHDFADIIEHDVLASRDFAPLAARGRVHMLRMPAQALPGSGKYDFIISGLPLTAFELRDVQEVFAVIRRLLRPGGVFSYFEYQWLRRTSRMLAVGKRRDRIRAVNSYLTKNLREHKFAGKTVLLNFPPAYAHHLRFDA